MGFKNKGMENYLPDSRHPGLPEGLHVCKILKAHWFVGQKKKRDTFVAELRVVESDDETNVGKVFSFVKVENEFPEYYLAAVRGFVSAALDVPIDNVDGDVAEAAVNERDDAPGIATGLMVVVDVTENNQKPEFPNIMFSPYAP